jgi:hypothetical protein
MIQSLSDKALLEMARHGEAEATEILMKRWAVKNVAPEVVTAEWRKLRGLSVTAAKRVAALAAASVHGGCC